jgi:hypothetical protein
MDDSSALKLHPLNTCSSGTIAPCGIVVNKKFKEFSKFQGKAAVFKSQVENHTNGLPPSARFSRHEPFNEKDFQRLQAFGSLLITEPRRLLLPSSIDIVRVTVQCRAVIHVAQGIEDVRVNTVLDVVDRAVGEDRVNARGVGGAEAKLRRPGDRAPTVDSIDVCRPFAGGPAAKSSRGLSSYSRLAGLVGPS